MVKLSRAVWQCGQAVKQFCLRC